MIENFMCATCVHSGVCEKIKDLMKFHESAKKDLGIAITMEDCEDYLANEEQETEDEEILQDKRKRSKSKTGEVV